MKKLVSLFMVLTLLCMLFAGCGSTASGSASAAASSEAEASSAEAEAPAEEAEEAPAEAEQAEEAPAAESAAEASAAEEASDEIPGKVVYDLPLFDEPLTFTMFYPIAGGMTNETEDTIYTYPFWENVSEILNVSPTFQRPTEDTAAEKYNLMVAARDLTDVVYQGRKCQYNTGLDAAVEDEVYADLTDLVADYAPNYLAMINADEQVAKEIYTEAGRIVTVTSINDAPSGTSQGMLVNTDLLNETGMEISNVVEDWVEIFQALQANGTPHPLATTPSGNAGNNAFYYAYGTTGSTSAMMVDLASGEVYYDAISDGYKDYINFFRDMYSQGIIDPDFYNTFGQEYFMDGTYATWMGNYQDLTTFPANYGKNVDAVPPLHLADSTTGEPKTTDYSSSVQMTGGAAGLCFAATCENLTDILKFFDYFYSDEGALNMNYGFVEGQSYEVLPDGSRQMLTEMLDRDTVTNLTGRSTSTIFEGWGYIYTRTQLDIESEAAVAANDLWSSADPDAAECMALPSMVTLTQEENEEAASILSDIETYASSQQMQWFTLGEDFDDAAWDAYVAEIEDMGIDQVVAIYQGAYERYVNK